MALRLSRRFDPHELDTYNRTFATASPKEILVWTLEHFTHHAVLTVSFGGGGLVLAHLISEIDRTIPVIFLDTGLHFPETYAFKQQFTERYRLNLVDVRPVTDPGPLYETDPDRCCHIRKVEPMQRAIKGYDAWISAIRKDQSQTRRHIRTLEYQSATTDNATDAILKVYPLAYWTNADVWRYLYQQNIPYHPLLDQGYGSIGCWPCTRALQAGEDERAGRWSGREKTECGLHAFESVPSSSSSSLNS